MTVSGCSGCRAINPTWRAPRRPSSPLLPAPRATAARVSTIPATAFRAATSRRAPSAPGSRKRRRCSATSPSGKQIIVGSSMGGYIALLLLRRLLMAAPEEAARIAGLVLIAPAWDMTEELMWKQFNLKARRELQDTGVFRQPSEYGEPYAITRALIEEGRSHLMAKRPFDPGQAGRHPAGAPRYGRACWPCARAARAAARRLGPIDRDSGWRAPSVATAGLVAPFH